MAAIPFDEDAAYRGLEASPAGEPGFTWLERNWLRPSLDVNGVWGRYTGAGSKTVIPNKAFAKVTMRLVPGQDPATSLAAMINHLKARCPSGSSLTFNINRGASSAYSVPGIHPLLLAVDKALEDTTGRRPARVGIGATLPVASMIAGTLGLDTVMFSYSTADEDYHAPNEFFRKSAINEGFEGWVDLLRYLGHQTRDTYVPF